MTMTMYSRSCSDVCLLTPSHHPTQRRLDVVMIQPLHKHAGVGRRSVTSTAALFADRRVTQWPTRPPTNCLRCNWQHAGQIRQHLTIISHLIFLFSNTLQHTAAWKWQAKMQAWLDNALYSCCAWREYIGWPQKWRHYFDRWHVKNAIN